MTIATSYVTSVDVKAKQLGQVSNLIGQALDVVAKAYAGSLSKEREYLSVLDAYNSMNTRYATARDLLAQAEDELALVNRWYPYKIQKDEPSVSEPDDYVVFDKQGGGADTIESTNDVTALSSTFFYDGTGAEPSDVILLVDFPSDDGEHTVTTAGADKLTCAGAGFTTSNGNDNAYVRLQRRDN